MAEVAMSVSSDPAPTAPGRTLRGSGGPAADLSDLLQTLPSDVERAAGDLAGRASLLIGNPVTVAAWSGRGWTALAGPGTGLAGLPPHGAGPAGTNRAGVLVVAGGYVGICWNPHVSLEPEWRNLLGQAGTWLSLLILRRRSDTEIEAAAGEAAAV